MINSKGAKDPGPTQDKPVYSWVMTLGTHASTLPGLFTLGLIATAFAFTPFVSQALGLAQAGGPRVLQEPGFTRVVLEMDTMPVINEVQLESRGLKVTVQGMLGENTLEGAPDTSELIAWRLEPNGETGTISLKTTFPLELDRGYHVFALPASDGLGDRLVIDLGPEIGPEMKPELAAPASPVAPNPMAVTKPVSSTPAKVTPSKPVSSARTQSQPSPSKPVSTAPASSPPVSRPTDQPGVTLTASRIPPKRTPTVVIDPGHGGIDPGMSGYVREKNVTLSISLKLRALLQKAGIKVVMSRTGDYAWQGQRGCNKACDLKKRADLASTDRNVFVSVHVNAGGGYGIDTYIFGEPLGAEALRQAERENGGGAIGRELTRQARDTARSLVNDQLAQDNLKLSSTLAYSVQRNLIAQTGSRNLGVKSSSLAVLRRARIPAILAEVGFGDHPVEGKNLALNSYQNKLALGLSKGIRAFLGY
jgi:N-acetylmuramoyl-L-alanine amidase